MTLIFFALAFFSGALPFSAWLARGLAHAELRQVGDGNPGAANAWKAGGWRVGALALLLDYLRGAVPVALAHFGWHLAGLPLGAVAVAPILGHAFSPFLNFRGGKGLTVTFGAWSGLTLAQAPLILGLFMALFYFVVAGEAWAVMASLLGLLAHLLLQRADLALLAAWAGNAAVLVWTHRRELRRRPGLKPLPFGWRRSPGARTSEPTA